MRGPWPPTWRLRGSPGGSRWTFCRACRCMELERQAPGWEELFQPVVLRRFQAKVCQALYYRYDLERPWPQQFEENLLWLEGQKFASPRCNSGSIEKTDRYFLYYQ